MIHIYSIALNATLKYLQLMFHTNVAWMRLLLGMMESLWPAPAFVVSILLFTCYYIQLLGMWSSFHTIQCNAKLSICNH